MTDGPLPSKLCFLSQIPAQKIGAKIRFLGCVTAYDIKTATAHLGHLYPRDTNVLVAVDLRLVLEMIKPETTSVGEWVNVIGYVVDGREKEGDVAADGCVRALMMWSTGPLDVGEYERTLEEGLLLDV